jgi:Protein of unknown function (DUF2510)
VTESPPPGWYDEPGGNHALLRWWDGRSWTAVTRTRAATEQLPPGRTAVDVLEAEPPRQSRRGWVIAAIAAAVVLIIVVAGLPGRQSGGGLADRGTGPGSATLVPTDPAPTTAQPVSGRFEDRVARLSYDVLPGSWREWDRESFDGLQSTLGYYRVTQEHAPLNQTYWANVNSGPVEPEIVASGDLARTADRLIQKLGQVYYPKHSRTELVRRTLTVDGAPAALVRYKAVFDPEAAAGYSAKSEQVVVLVVNTGQDVPSALYVSLPDTVRALWPSIDGLLAGVRVIR